MLPTLPDLAHPLTSGTGSVFRAFGTPGVAVVVPDRLTLRRHSDGTPDVLLTRVHADPPTGGLTVGLLADADLGSIGRELAGGGEALYLTTASADAGVLILAGADHTVATAALGHDVLLWTSYDADLTEPYAELTERMLRHGRMPVEVTLRLDLTAIAPRLDLALTFDRRDVAARLAERFGASALVEERDLTTALDEEVGGPLPAMNPAGSIRSTAIALRLRDRFAIAEAATGVVYRLRPVAEVEAGTERVNLAEPVAVRVHRMLALDPAAADAAIAGTPEDLVRHTEAPTADELEVSARLPEPIAGLRKLFADVRLTPDGAVLAGVELPVPDRTTLVELPEEGNDTAEVRLRATLDAVDGTTEVAGSWLLGGGRRWMNGPGAFPVPLTAVRATAALTDIAAVEVRTANDRSIARLDTGSPTTAIPRLPADEPLTLVVQPLGPGRIVKLALDRGARTDLDPATLPGYGMHHAKLTGGRRSIRVEWLPEGADDSYRQSVSLGPGRTSVDIAWLATSPFQPGFRWRTAGDGPPGPWSPPVLPAEGAAVAVDSGPIVDEIEVVTVGDIELRSRPSTPGTWYYLPPGPMLDRLPGGGHAVGLIEAGTVAFLQLTSRLDLFSGDRDDLLKRLREIRPAATAIRPEPVVVRGVHLEARTADGWVMVAEGTSSGVPPWITALSASVQHPATAPVKAALAGIRDRLRLRAEFVVPATSPGTFRTTTTTAYASAVSPGTRIQTQTQHHSATAAADQPERLVEHIRDVADLLAT